MDSAGWSATAAWVTAAIYAALLIYAVKQVNEAKHLRRAQVRPFVVVDIAPGHLLYVTVENIGSTLARNVVFDFPTRMESSVEKSRFIDELPLFKDGLTVLPPHKRYRVFFDSYLSRMEAQRLPMFYDVTVRYEDDDANPYEDSYRLDLNSFLETSPMEKGLPELVDELKTIRETLAKWTDGSRGLLVHGRDKDEMLERERERRAEWLAAREAGRGAGEPTA